jgi:site-specific DNA recombinase
MFRKRGTAEEEVFEGRHPALIAQETFDTVQMLLDEKRVAGERPRKRQHYLHGSVFCHHCGSRLTYGISTGQNGRRYPYFFCASRVNRTDCTERTNYPPKMIEAAIERYHASGPIELTPERLQQSCDAIRTLAAVSQEALSQVRAAKTDLIARLKTQQAGLLRLYAEGDDASPDALRDERARMQNEIAEAERSLAETLAETKTRMG